MPGTTGGDAKPTHSKEMCERCSDEIRRIVKKKTYVLEPGRVQMWVGVISAAPTAQQHQPRQLEFSRDLLSSPCKMGTPLFSCEWMISIPNNQDVCTASTGMLKKTSKLL